MKSKILFGLCLLAGLMLINSGINKFTGHMTLPEMTPEAGALMGAFAKAGWLFPLIAIAEIIGGILFIIPKYRALGAIILFPVIVGIVLTHAVLDPAPAGLGVSFFLLGANLWAIFDNLHKYMPMIADEK